jgi:hypothetical protein
VTPGGKKTPIVSIIDDTTAITARSRRSTFPCSFGSLKRMGVNITEINSTVDNEGL